MQQIQPDHNTPHTLVKSECDSASNGFSFQLRALRAVEVWHQLPEDPDLWHGPHGVIVNSAALEQRKLSFALIRIRAAIPGSGG